MDICFFSVKPYDIASFEAHPLAQQHTLYFSPHHLTHDSAMIAAGYNNVDLQAANDLGMTVARVPAYSPYAVAEHAVSLIFALNRQIHRAYNRVREHDFSLHGLLGFDSRGCLQGETVL